VSISPAFVSFAALVPSLEALGAAEVLAEASAFVSGSTLACLAAAASSLASSSSSSAGRLPEASHVVSFAVVVRWGEKQNKRKMRNKNQEENAKQNKRKMRNKTRRGK